MRFRILMASMIVLLVVGLGILLYPSISDMYNRHVSSKAVATYVESTQDLNDDERETMLNQAREYNATLVGAGVTRFLPGTESHERYESIMDVTGTGIMAYVTVPKISVRTPVYHGTSDMVLQVAAGHIEGSSLPVGGESTHAALSGHTGLPSAMLFTGLDRLEKGDTFTVTVFDDVLTYEVNAIHVVEPDDVSNLAIVEGEDLVSLITCTPYGVNSHRLIVTGHRIPTVSTNEPVDHALRKDIAFIVGAVVLAAAMVAIIFHRQYRMMNSTKVGGAGSAGSAVGVGSDVTADSTGIANLADSQTGDTQTVEPRHKGPRHKKK